MPPFPKFFYSLPGLLLAAALWQPPLPLAAEEAETAAPTFAERLVAAALQRTTQTVRYDPAYVVLDYPGGDVRAGTGVCTDVVIRSYRAVGIDLQPLVHRDMRANFSRYPKNWGLSRADKNIDHRRVPNLQTFFKRHGTSLPVTAEPADYLPGDLVAWDLNGRGLVHIGIVVDPPDGKAEAGSQWIVHNIGCGPVREKRLFEWEILGHYRYGDGVTPNHEPLPSPSS